MSSAESEFIALTYCTQEVMWVMDILAELGFELGKATIIKEDNQACIAIANNPVHKGRTKHLGRRIAFVREAVKNDSIKLEYCSTKEMIADIFTKPLGSRAFIKFRNGLGIDTSPNQGEC